MPYLKIKGNETHYDVTLHPFTSQHGYDAVRFVGDIVPSTNNGFEYFNDDDTLLADLSAYKYEYHPNEYTVEQEHEELPSGTPTPPTPSALDRLSARVSQLSAQVSTVTPYEETKRAFYGEKEKAFHGVPSGNVTVFFDNYNDGYKIERIDDMVLVRFKEMIKDVTSVTIMVQK